MTSAPQHLNRGHALILLFGTFALVAMTVATFVAAALGIRSVDEMTRLYALFVAPWFGIVGPLVGFYVADARR